MQVFIGGGAVTYGKIHQVTLFINLPACTSWSALPRECRIGCRGGVPYNKLLILHLEFPCGNGSRLENHASARYV
jgi:hypothetical protein